MIVKGRIITITEDPVSQEATVYVQLSDNKGFSWEKNYTYKVTTPITEKQFQDRLKKDLIADLKPKGYIAELQSAIGKEFTLNI